MTVLNKPVARLTRGAYSVLYRKPRQIVCALVPGDLLEFREKGRRAKWALPIDEAFLSAVRLETRRVQLERRLKKKGSR